MHWWMWGMQFFGNFSKIVFDDSPPAPPPPSTPSEGIRPSLVENPVSVPGMVKWGFYFIPRKLSVKYSSSTQSENLFQHVRSLHTTYKFCVVSLSHETVIPHPCPMGLFQRHEITVQRVWCGPRPLVAFNITLGVNSISTVSMCTLVQGTKFLNYFLDLYSVLLTTAVICS